MARSLDHLREPQLMEVLEELEGIITANTGGLVSLSPPTEQLILDLMDEVRAQPIDGASASPRS